MIIDPPRKEQIIELRRLWTEAFGDTEEFLDTFWGTAFRPDHCRCVTLEGQVAAALYWFDCSCRERPIAYFYAIATQKAHRGKGLCRALMEDTHRHLKTLGYVGAILVPGDQELFDFYKKIGYQTCSYIGELCCSASKYPLQIRKIDEIQYAQLRRRFLPEGGVVQENENLKFLKTTANFYTGNGFLLAARQEADVLYGIELLGEAAAAPALVASFGCTKGRFRTPGAEKDFAMYYSLGDSETDPPNYFGLAFD